MSVGGPTDEDRPPTADVLANALLAACGGDYIAAIQLLHRALEVLYKAQETRLNEASPWRP